MKSISKTVVIGLDAAVSLLIEKYIAEGWMPNLKALIQAGAYTRARALFPGVTPINWATIATGAYPGTHGITDFAGLDPHDPLDGGGTGLFPSLIKRRRYGRRPAVRDTMPPR